ncbi:MAG: fumarate hydratase, partial [Candidatus Omnitrophica bacterium]|nr:fumarate hydratase [Candidatus Omnitrophota bacterium]
VFVEIGEGVKVVGDLEGAINEGVSRAYREGYLRKSICEPLSRINNQDNTPAIIYTRIVKGNKLRIALCVKGFGAENKSQIKMFEPTASLKEIKEFVIKVVKEAGPDACPPFILGIGIGGTFEQAALLAKEATLMKIQNSEFKIQNKIHKLRKELREEINKLGIGPMGLGGRTTCLGVNILTYPTHIAGLPVAVNISCHATRSAEIVL